MDFCTIQGKEYDSNVYVVSGKIPTIIDTGTGFYSKQIIDRIQKVIPITRIQQVVLTHEHYDHVGGVADILELTDGAAKVLAHKDVALKLKEGKSTFAEMLGGVMPKITVDIPLTDNQQMTLGDESFDVIFTPGHSIGSLCLYENNSKSLFSGDTVFAHGGFGRYDFPGGDFYSLILSLERLSTLQVERLYPGHGPIVETYGNEHILLALSNIRSLI